ncbi:P-loop containing nucleoside triphosphate hydrolase protein, partial [Dendryphion nanum]
QPPLVPCSTVPFRRDSHFVDRQILAKISSKRKKPASRVALVGLGGIGKSQLAVEYSYRVREGSPSTWVFWVHGSNLTRFREGYQSIAEKARIPVCNQPNVDLLKLVHDWLCNEAIGPWLMIIDNADDLSLFSRQANKSDGGEERVGNGTYAVLLDCIPQSQNGSVLITSRSREAAFVLTGSYSDIISIGPMGQAHALALLRNKVEGNFEENDAISLVNALDYMPLAISQAAAYISQRVPRATVKRYLDEIWKGDQERAWLLDLDISDSRRDGTASNSIMATWQISFQHIRQTRPSATQLLSLMSLFDRQGIPESLLIRYYQQNDRGGLELDEDLSTLMDYSLISANIGGEQFEMHRLVQLSTKKWLELNHELDLWKGKYAIFINNNYPPGGYENWSIYQQLFPHTQSALSCRPNDQNALKAWALLLYKVADYASHMGHYEISERMYRAALEVWTADLGPDHIFTINCLDGLSIAMSNQEKHKDAEELSRHSVERSEKILGKEHPHTLISKTNLVYTLHRRGKYEEAEELCRHTLEVKEKILGGEDSDTLATKGKLAAVLQSLGRYEEAENLSRTTLELQERILGKEHPDTLNSKTRLAFTLKELGRYEAAEELCRSCLEMKEKILGKEHFNTIASRGDLASILHGLGRHKEAVEMSQQVLVEREKVLGREHPATLYGAHDTACILHKQGNYTAAFELYQRASIGLERTLGSQHPLTLRCSKNLELLREQMGHST